MTRAAARRWWRSLLAVATVACLALVSAPPASARWAEQYWFGQLSINKAWGLTKGAGVTVAVVDSGVVGTLGDLRGQVLPGADFSGQHTDGRSDPGNECGTYGGCYSHGTHMSLLIAGTGAGKGYQGVAPGVKILPVKVQARTGAQASAQAIGQGIRWAVDHGAKIINASIGHPGSCDAYEGPAVRYAYDHDVIVVAAAGNDGQDAVDSPADCPGALGISATDGGPAEGAIPIWSGSNYGPQVAFTGIGVDMPQETLDGTKVLHANGTSDATAIVSACLALIRAHFPTMSARDVVTRALWAVHNGAGVANLGKRINDKIGYGMILPYPAMTTAPPAGAANPIYDAWQKDFAAQPGSSSSPGTTGSSTRSPSVPAGSIQAPAPPHHADSGPSGNGTLIGIVVGIVVVLIVVAAFLLYRRRRAGVPPGA